MDLPNLLDPGDPPREGAAQDGPSSRRGHHRGRGGQPRGRGRGARPQTRDQNPPQRGETHATSQRQRGNAAIHGVNRQFGGHLSSNVTSDEPPTAAPAPPTSTLHADAPEFRPGRPHRSRNLPNRPAVSTRNKNNNNSNTTTSDATPRSSEPARSTAPDIATRIHEDIQNSNYECAICTDSIGPRSRIWSCRTCWTVFHLSCANKWAQDERSSVSRQPVDPDEVNPPPRQWRCPGCNLPRDDLPSSYGCWCEKEIAPRQVPGLPPHSCGQTCGKPRVLPKKCPHPCELSCHAGPCPPCQRTGLARTCFCGKKAFTRRCVDVDYDRGESCGDVCGDLLPCGEHTCPRPCHEGFCGECRALLPARCYCGKVEKTVICSDKREAKKSRRNKTDADGTTHCDEWAGIFSCKETCDRLFDCGVHRCFKPCHSQDVDPSHCPRSPDVVRNCHCGQTPLTSLLSSPRTSCEDAIPSCQRLCQKRLSCGHFCENTCHAGDCPPCSVAVSFSCRCGRTASETICHQGMTEQPRCSRVCKTTLNCGRHECGERCCPGERRATERLANKRRMRPLGMSSQRLDEGFEAEHICTRICGRQVRCGNHTCPELCHRGPCGSCREAIFDEVACHCGRTVLHPPLPCGTKPPTCSFECTRTKVCGHPQTHHNCHGDDETCPPCPFLVEKRCACGKKTLVNQPCFLAEVHCGEVCKRKLRCGLHACRKNCHKPGECEDVITSTTTTTTAAGGSGSSTSKPCAQTCGKTKKACGHPCEEPCHAPAACKEDKPCSHKTLITCDCQHLKTEVRCLATRSSPGNSSKTLKCDDECARLERNRRLAMALNVDPETAQANSQHVPYSATTLQLYQELNAKGWANAQERELRIFAADEEARRLRFKPMQRSQRAFIHALAEDFGLDGESMDPEPHRHVALFKTPRFVASPIKTLGECVRVRTIASLQESQNKPVSSSLSSSSGGALAKPQQLFNAYVLSSPRFGIVVEDVRSDLSTFFASADRTLAFDISFLPASDEVVIFASPKLPTSSSASHTDNMLRQLKPSLVSQVLQKQLAGSVNLCAAAADPNVAGSYTVLRKEGLPVVAGGRGIAGTGAGASTGGWSEVAAKNSAPLRFAPEKESFGTKNAFVALGSKARKKREEEERRRHEEEVVEDWEEEIDKEERDKGWAAQGGDELESGVEGLLDGKHNDRELEANDKQSETEKTEKPRETSPATSDKAPTIPNDFETS